MLNKILTPVIAITSIPRAVSPTQYYGSEQGFFKYQEPLLETSTSIVTASGPQPGVAQASENLINWDGWPNGNFEQDFDWDAVKKTGNIAVHWAYKTHGGDRKGEDTAATWLQGKQSTRQCLGIIICDNESCEIVVRPHTRPTGIHDQLQKPCSCGAKLQHLTCPVRSKLWKWIDGIHYSNGGFHTHNRPTHTLHLLPEERHHFDAIVSAHPGIGPLRLIVGVPGINGPGESVADISDVLLNADRVSKEKQKLKKTKMQGGDGFVSAFAKFSTDHPGFVIYSQLGPITVICLQTAFMASQLLKGDLIRTGPVNGFVNDAAHGWWHERNSLLVVTSVYCPELMCWVPGLFSYTNGASAEHYKIHFLALMQSIAHEAETRGLEVIDRFFAGVISIFIH